MKLEIKKYWTGEVLFTAELSVEDQKLSASMQLGVAIKQAIQAKANLGGANLGGANLGGADLSGADLRSANLGGANLSGANLGGADLSGADLRSANLGGADLSGANLRSANLGGANLSGADLSGAKNLVGVQAARLLMCPEEGSFIAWKKCQGDVIVKLLVPAESRRSTATSRKCRTEFVDVLEVFGADVGVSGYNPDVKYRKGERVTCDTWNEDCWVECGGGIHFFITRAEAEAYEL